MKNSSFSQGSAPLHVKSKPRLSQKTNTLNMKLPFSILTLSSVVATAIALTGPEIATYFSQHLSSASTVYLPGSSDYASNTTQRWNAFSEPTYIVAVKPSTEVDVQKIVSSWMWATRRCSCVGRQSH